MNHRGALVLLLEMSCRFLRWDNPKRNTPRFNKVKREEAKKAVKLIWFRVHEKEMTQEQEAIVFGD